METAKDCEVFAPKDPIDNLHLALTARKGRFGSGYLVGDGPLLTAAHVVERAHEGTCQVRLLESTERLEAEGAWCGKDCDAALPGIGAAAGPLQAVLGRHTGSGRAACRALGGVWVRPEGGHVELPSTDREGSRLIVPSVYVECGRVEDATETRQLKLRAWERT